MSATPKAFEGWAKETKVLSVLAAPVVLGQLGIVRNGACGRG